MADRCMGHCCTDIGLPFSPDELKKFYSDWLIGGEPVSMSPYQSKNSRYGEMWLLFPMLTFLRSNQIHPESPWEKNKFSTFYHYSCKHFDQKNKKCTIYEFRPKMCVTYPDKEYCSNPGCKSSKLKKGRPRIITNLISAWNKGDKRRIKKLLNHSKEKNIKFKKVDHEQ